MCILILTLSHCPPLPGTAPTTTITIHKSLLKICLRYQRCNQHQPTQIDLSIARHKAKSTRTTTTTIHSGHPHTPITSPYYHPHTVPTYYHPHYLSRLILPPHQPPHKRHIGPIPRHKVRRRRRRQGTGISKRILHVVLLHGLPLALLPGQQPRDRDAAARVHGALLGARRRPLPPDLDAARHGFGILLANDAADDLGPVVRQGDVTQAPVYEVLVLEVGARGLGLHAARAGAFVGGDEDDVGEGDGAGEGGGEGRVEAVLEQQAELVGLGLPDRVDFDGAVRREGGLGVGVDAVGEGGGGDGCQVGQVDGEFVWYGGVGDEDAVGADGFEEGEFVQPDCLVIWDLSV